jgi:hypothetical protein
MRLEFLDGLPSGGRLRNHLHIGFEADQRGYALTKKSVVVRRENSDGLIAHNFALLRRRQNRHPLSVRA